MDLFQYLEANKDYISIGAVEKAVDIPSGTLRAVMNGDRQLPPKYTIPLKDFICTHFRTKLEIISQKPKGKDVVDDINHYDLIAPNTYAHKKTGEVFKINYHDGAFRFL